MNRGTLIPGFALVLLVAGPAGQFHLQDASAPDGANGIVVDTIDLDKNLYVAWRIKASDDGYLRLYAKAAQDTSTTVAFGYWAWPVEDPSLRSEWWAVMSGSHQGERIALKAGDHGIAHSSNMGCHLGLVLELPGECLVSYGIEGPTRSGEWIVLAVIAANGQLADGSELELTFESPGAYFLGKRTGEAFVYREEDIEGGTTAYFEGFGFLSANVLQEGSLIEQAHSELWGFVLANSNTGFFEMTHEGPEGKKFIEAGKFYLFEGAPSGNHVFSVAHHVDAGAGLAPAHIVILSADVEFP